MSRLLIAIAAMVTTLTAGQALAQDEAGAGFRTEIITEPRGVFEGSIGRYPIIACFDVRYDGDGFGSYYYLSQLKPIPLVAKEATNQWSEGSAYRFGVDEGAPVWNIRMGSKGDFTGTWRSEKRTYPIRLTRIAKGAEEYEGACGTDNFLRPRLAAPQFTRTAASLDGFAYTVLDFISPAHFSEVSISSFTFAPSQPGDAAINEKLAAMLPSGSTLDEYVQCMAGNLVSSGVDGDYEMSASPRFANEQLLSVETINGDYCGGAHPNYWQGYFLYDRQSGEQIDSASWFNETGIKVSEYDSKLMQPPLQQAVLAHWPAEADPECRDVVEDQQYWNFQLLAGGISFQPDLPHVATVCEERILLSWDEVSPFLSADGLSLRERAQR